MRAAPLALLLSCGKVPIHDVQAGFTLADASWFAAEQTLFVFYEVEAEQGLGDASQIELTWTTDDGVVGWTALTALDPVHRHVPVDCGARALCGSMSVRVAGEPRDVRLRLRYHRDGELALPADTVFNVVGTGPVYSHRSLLVYGVFDEGNARVQWRARHQFPTIRNQRAERLGLRRAFTIDEVGHGQVPPNDDRNPYLVGVPCAGADLPLGMSPLTTDDRAAFHPDPLPEVALGSSGLCARATVIDGTGTFATSAIARKNPEVRAAFPVLRSPIQEARQLPFFLAPCDRTISDEHEAMQRQRLLMEGLPALCTDGWQRPTFRDELIVAFRDAVEAARPAGEDMVLVIGLHRDEDGLAAVVEDALAAVVPGERHRSTPRLAGAFVYDSVSRSIGSSELRPTTLWCPASIAAGSGASLVCAAAPDFPGIIIGPITLNQLQILPTRSGYLQFLETFTVGQAGSMVDLSFLAPEFATTADHVDFGEFGVVTFLNGETFAADADDAFSYCAPESTLPIAVRSPRMQDPAVMQALRTVCGLGLVPFELCGVPDTGLLPLESLPLWHVLSPESSYEVGLFWEFPYLLRLEYENVAAGAIGALGFSVPFGFASPAEAYYGTPVWLEEGFALDQALTQCSRFCDYPTFDPAGIYQVRALFREAYAQDCYLPDYPSPGDSGFPRDP